MLYPRDKKAIVLYTLLLSSPWIFLSSRPLQGLNPGRAKRESRRTLHAHVQNAAIFLPKLKEKPYLEVLPESACGTIFWIIIYKQQFLHSDWLKACQLIPNQRNFTSTTLNDIRFVFYHNIKNSERNLCQDLLRIENRDSDLGVRALHYANELFVCVRLSFQKLLQTPSTCRSNTKNWKCLGKEWWHVFNVDKSAEHDKPHFDLVKQRINSEV